MTITNPSLIYSGLSSNIKESCAVVVRKLPGEVNLNNISNYLSNYDPVNIRRAELIELEEGRSKYKLDEPLPVTFDLLIFVNEIFSLNDPNISNTYLGIGYINLPTLGSDNLDPDIYLDLSWNEIDSTADINFTSELTNEPTLELVNYESKNNIESHITMVNKNDLNNYGIKYLPSTESDSQGITNVNKGIISSNKFYEVPNIGIKVVNENINIIDTTYINYKSNEWVEILNSDGSKYMRNLTKYPKGVLMNTPYDPSTETWRVEEVPGIVTILTPDKITWKSSNKWRSIDYNDYKDNNYTKVTDIEFDIESFMEYPTNLVPGIDRISNDVNLVFSDISKQDKWYLQSKLTKIISNQIYLNSNSFKYYILEHNIRFYIGMEISNLGTSSFIIDYKGNRLNGFTYYKLLIDGSFIGKIGSEVRYYENDLSDYLVINSYDDLYNVYPSLYSDKILSSSPINPRELVLVRDRHFNLNNINSDTIKRISNIN